MGFFDKLNSEIEAAPKPKPVAQRASLKHPNSDQIVAAASAAIARSTTGKMLLDYADGAGITITALTNQSEGGYSPDGKQVFIGIPAGQEQGNVNAIIQLVSGLREAMQEDLDELKRPPLDWPEQHYGQRFVDRDRDALWHVCAVAHDLIYEYNMRELFDEMTRIGYHELLEAYGKDLKESQHIVSDEEIE